MRIYLCGDGGGLTRNDSPTGVQFMKRSGPPGQSDMSFSYDSELLKTIDVEFLVNVRTLVDAMVGADPSLKRVDAELVNPANQ